MDIDLLQNHGIVRFLLKFRVLNYFHGNIQISINTVVFSQNVADIKKLKTAGICTIKVITFFFNNYVNLKKLIKTYILAFFFQGVQMTTRRKMCQIKGISEAKMEKIKVYFLS